MLSTLSHLLHRRLTGRTRIQAAPADHPDSDHGHSPEEIAARLEAGPQANYLRDWVYGGIDGGVTTFAIVAGAAGAQLSSAIILVMGIANLLADGFSMAAGNFSATKTENDHYGRLRAMEERHIDQIPEGEREELRQIFAAKGFTGDDLESAVAIISSSRDRWLDFMLAEEHGLPGAVREPRRAALSTFAAFVLCGAVPLLPYLIGLDGGLAGSAVLTGIVFFAIGSVKSYWSLTSWWRSGLETLAIGMAAAGVAFGVGTLLRPLLA